MPVAGRSHDINATPAPKAMAANTGAKSGGCALRRAASIIWQNGTAAFYLSVKMSASAGGKKLPKWQQTQLLQTALASGSEQQMLEAMEAITGTRDPSEVSFQETANAAIILLIMLVAQLFPDFKWPEQLSSVPAVSVSNVSKAVSVKPKNSAASVAKVVSGKPTVSDIERMVNRALDDVESGAKSETETRKDIIEPQKTKVEELMREYIQNGFDLHEEVLEFMRFQIDKLNPENEAQILEETRTVKELLKMYREIGLRVDFVTSEGGSNPHDCDKNGLESTTMTTLSKSTEFTEKINSIISKLGNQILFGKLKLKFEMRIAEILKQCDRNKKTIIQSRIQKILGGISPPKSLEAEFNRVKTQYLLNQTENTVEEASQYIKLLMENLSSIENINLKSTKSNFDVEIGESEMIVKDVINKLELYDSLAPFLKLFKIVFDKTVQKVKSNYTNASETKDDKIVDSDLKDSETSITTTLSDMTNLIGGMDSNDSRIQDIKDKFLFQKKNLSTKDFDAKEFINGKLTQGTKSIKENTLKALKTLLDDLQTIDEETLQSEIETAKENIKNTISYADDIIKRRNQFDENFKSLQETPEIRKLDNGDLEYVKVEGNAAPDENFMINEVVQKNQKYEKYFNKVRENWTNRQNLSWNDIEKLNLSQNERDGLFKELIDEIKVHKKKIAVKIKNIDKALNKTSITELEKCVANINEIDKIAESVTDFEKKPSVEGFKRIQTEIEDIDKKTSPLAKDYLKELKTRFKKFEKIEMSSASLDLVGRLKKLAEEQKNTQEIVSRALDQII